MNLINTMKGFFIGIALVVPGLSGSMFAVIVGLYDKILDCINDFFNQTKKSILFLLPIVLGIGIGILSSTKIVLWICEEYMFQSYSFFIGLVIGSFPLIFRKITSQQIKLYKFLISIITLIIILFISNISNNLNNDISQSYVSITSLSSIKDILIVFFAGAFSCSLMAIPGVSGSVMLMLINQYGTIYNSVSKLTDFMKYLILRDFINAKSVLSTVIIIIPFFVGAIVGIFLIAKLLGYFIKNFETEVYYGVFGIVLGAIIALFNDGIYNNFIYAVQSQNKESIVIILSIAIFIIIGFLCTKFLDKN